MEGASSRYDIFLSSPFSNLCATYCPGQRKKNCYIEKTFHLPLFFSLLPMHLADLQVHSLSSKGQDRWHGSKNREEVGFPPEKNNKK
jgi:hypothetical protein